MSKADRGFASMDKAKHAEIASRGGKAAHRKGVAHQWTSEEARAAGRKGGLVSKGGRAKVLNNQPIQGDFSLPDPNKPETDLGE